MSTLTAGVAPKLVIAGHGNLVNSRKSGAGLRNRLMRATDEEAVVVHSDFWIFRISEADSVVMRAKKTWPRIDALFWRSFSKICGPKSLPDTRRLLVNRSTTIDIGVERQRGICPAGDRS